MKKHHKMGLFLLFIGLLSVPIEWDITAAVFLWFIGLALIFNGEGYVE